MHLISLNQKGLIPGPNESEAAFLERCQYCLNLNEILSGQLDYEFFEKEDDSSFKSSFKESKKNYDITPDWIPLVYHNKKLPFWHGGCAWIFQLEKNSPTAAVLQLRKELAENEKILWLYDKQEIIVHELSHVGRMMYEEPRYEEHLAYLSSPSSWRRFIGPLFQSSYESIVFMLCLLFLIAWDLFVIYSGFSFGLKLSLYFKGVLLLMIALGCIRLFYRHHKMSKCLKHLSSITSNPNYVLYRLTDREIDLFSQLSSKEIEDYATQESNKELRWKVIHQSYFCR